MSLFSWKLATWPDAADGACTRWQMSPCALDECWPSTGALTLLALSCPLSHSSRRGDYRTGDELDELQAQELRKRRAKEGPRQRPPDVLSHLLDLDSPFETDLVVDAAPFVSDTCRMKTLAGLINHHSGIADRPNVCFVHAVRGTGFEPLPRMKLPLCFLVALEDIPPSTEAVVDYETGSESYLAVLEQLHQRARQVKLEEFAAGAAALL